MLTAPLEYPKYLATSLMDLPDLTMSTALALNLGSLGLVVYAIWGNVLIDNCLVYQNVSKVLGYYVTVDKLSIQVYT